MNTNWDDSNLLIGGKIPTSEETQILSKIERAKEIELLSDLEKLFRQGSNHWWLEFQPTWEERVGYGVIEGLPGFPITILRNSKERRKFNWVLDNNFEKWRFVPDSLIYVPTDNPSCWGIHEFIREISFWGKGIVDGHYRGLALWLFFDEMPAGDKKDKMREMLYCTDLIEMKPHYNLSVATRLFARQFYAFSEVAQRAEDENHLYFCIEYSKYLSNFSDEQNPSKDEVCNTRTEKIKFFRDALEAGKSYPDFPQLLTLEQIQEDGHDWRLCIEDLILCDIIRICWESDSPAEKDMKHHLRNYLNALAHHNGVVRHRPGHTPVRLKKEAKRSRGKGRPPKGSNVKNC